MVIDKDPNRRHETPVVEDESVQKENLLNEMRKESLAIICLALMYAKNFEETGMDITTRWVTAEQQADALQKCFDKGYNTGYQDGIKSGREFERKKMEKMQRKGKA